MASTPRTPEPERAPPPLPPPPIEKPRRDPSPSPPGEEFRTPTPSFEASPREASPPEEYGSANNDDDGTAIAKSPQLSPLHFPSPSSPADNSNGQQGRAAAPAPAGHARAQLHLATGLVRTPSQGSAAAKSPSPSPSPPSPLTPAPAVKSPSPSPSSPLTPAPTAKSPSRSPSSPLTPAPVAKSPSPPSPLTPAPAAKSPSPSPPSPLTPAPGPTANSNKSGQGTPKRAEVWKPPPPPPLASPGIAAQFDPAEEAATSPLQVSRPRLDQHQRTPAFANENGGAAAAGVPSDVAAVVDVAERRSLSVALRLATAVLSLAAFSVMVSARTTGWAGDYFGRHEQYRYAVGVNVIVCAYSIAQSIGEVRRLISPTFIFRSMSSYYFSLFLDQALAYLLMSASSAAASRNDLWVSRFGTDAFNKKINSAVWLSFIAFLTLAANALNSTANLFTLQHGLRTD